jgi:nitrogen regulatory protein PII
LLSQAALETLVEDYKATQIAEAIKRAVRTRRIGSKKVLVLSVGGLVHLLTGERDSHAI